FDLDGDGQRDNVFGNLLSAILGANDDLRDVEARVDGRFARHDVLWLIGVRDCTDGGHQVELRHGVVAGPQSAAAGSAGGVIELVGDAVPFPARADVSGVLFGDAGQGDVPLSVLIDPVGTFAPVAWRTGERAAVRLSVGDRELTGNVGFALRMPDGAHDLVAPFAAYLSAELRAGISPFAARLDANHDRGCTPDELLASDVG